MTRPKVIMVNAVSLDGSFINFEFDRALFHELTRDYRSVMILEGSQSLVTGLTDMHKGFIPPEEESDFIKPDKKPDEPYFVVPDSGVSRKVCCTSRDGCADRWAWVMM